MALGNGEFIFYGKNRLIGFNNTLLDRFIAENTAFNFMGGFLIAEISGISISLSEITAVT
jgi:hypothetical protein